MTFFERVYFAVSQVPPGQVATYGQIAAVLGRARGARAVGWALHALNDTQAELVPWWRIINAQGRISSACREHSAILQRQLLEAEGIPFRPDGRIPLDQVQWPITSEGEFRALHP
jgi:methylated-DNA-protein-cysteine methyltransferase-like protein